MKHLFLLLLTLIFSTSVFSRPVNVPVPVPNDNMVIETINVDNISYPDFSNRFSIQFKIADMAFHRDFGQAIEVPRMTSLPQSVKNEFERRFNDEKLQVSTICYSNQLAMVNSSNLIIGWAPLPEDVLATDWDILE